MESLSLGQRAAVWRYLVGRGTNAYFSRTPATMLRWDLYGERWSLTTRTRRRRATGPKRTPVLATPERMASTGRVHVGRGALAGVMLAFQ